MRWNPYFNAVGATIYISCVASLIAYISTLLHDTPDTVVGSIAFLSLLVLSAAVMGFLFFYRPVMLLIENKKEEAIYFFLKTLISFGVITLLLVLTIANCPYCSL